MHAPSPVYPILLPYSFLGPREGRPATISMALAHKLALQEAVSLTVP